MSKCRCLIADDEPLAVKLLQSYCDRIEGVELVCACTSGAEALRVLRGGGVDVAVLDIQMPQITGLEIARAIGDCGAEVIFVTAYPGYALEGFRVHAADYLLKPVAFEDFSAALGRVCGRLKPGPADAFLTVRADYRQVRLPYEDILYVEGLKDYVKIYVDGRDRPIITQMSMKAAECALPTGRFVRIHRSYIVATDRIEAYDRSTVRLSVAVLPVGDTYRSRFLKSL